MILINGTACFLRKGERKKDRKVLLLKRNRGRNDIHRGFYVPPSGHVERGERSLDNIIREFKEETGLRIIVPRLKVIATFYNKGRTINNKEVDDWRIDFYEANLFRGYLKTENKKDKLVWVPESEILTPNSKIKMHEGDRKIFNLLRDNGVYEVLLQYDKEKLIKFNYQKVHR